MRLVLVASWWSSDGVAVVLGRGLRPAAALPESSRISMWTIVLGEAMRRWPGLTRSL